MGLAASQARLLSITSRIADNELRSQTINNAKMRLAAEGSLASENYLNALNQANMLFNNYDVNGLPVAQTLSYNSIMAYSPYNNQYGLTNAAGQLLVSEEEANAFNSANGNLTDFLAEHGLRYDTTYFDPGVNGESVNVYNEDYPKKFQYVDADTLKEWYENYDAYANSAEMVTYNRYLGDYLNAATAYSKVLNYIASAYADSVISKDTGITDFNNNAPQKGNEYINYIYNAFKAFYPQMKDPSYKFTYETNTSNQTVGVSISNAASIDGVKKDENNQYVYELVTGGSVIFEVYKDENDGKEKCKVYTSYESDHDSSNPLICEGGTRSVPASYDTKGNPSGGRKDTYLSAYEVALYTLDDHQFAYTNSSGSNVTKIKDQYGGFVCFDFDKSGAANLKKGKSYIWYNSVYNYKEALKNCFGQILKTEFLSNYDGVAFGNAIIKDAVNNTNSYSINYGTTLDGTNMTYKNYIDNYIDAAYNYFSFIEGEPKLGENETKADALTKYFSLSSAVGGSNQEIYNNLIVLDDLLKTIKGNDDIVYTEEFANVVRAKIIDTMIDEYGEPRYGWIDDLDTSQTGNADARAQWYTNLFERMSKGFKVLENGLAASSEWLEFALESGIVTMEQVDKSYKWHSIDYNTCANITSESNTDALVAKAEAEYNRAMREIEAKDKMFDLELKNIDTEHNALLTEYDSVKNAMKGNIDRVLKFDQSS